MHARYRNVPGNAYRGNAMGMSSIAASSRISYEYPIRGHRMYNPDYRNYNRGGYGRGGYSKHFQEQIQPTREPDILIEAGRLAAEYLVSKELLSPVALSGKYTDALDKQFGNFEIRTHKTEAYDGRVPVHSRLGNSVPCLGQGKRRYPEEYISAGKISSMKGRKRAESFKGNGAEVNRDIKRTGSLNSNNKTSFYIEGGTNAIDGHDDGQPAVEDVHSDVKNSSVVENSQEADNDGHIIPGFVECSKSECAAAKDSSLSNEVSESSDVKGRTMKESHDVDKFDDSKDPSEGQDDNDLHQKFHEKEEIKDLHQKFHEKEEIKDLHQKCLEKEEIKDLHQKCDETVEIGAVSNDHVDLLKHCKFVNLPTRPRSSLTIKSSRTNRNSINEDKSISRGEILEGSNAHVMDADTGSSVCNDSSYQKQDFKVFHLHVTDSPSIENSVNLYSTKMHEECSMSGSKEQEIDDSLSSFGTSNSVLMESDKKLSVDCDVDDIEDVKKFSEWVLPLDMQSDCMSQVSTPMDIQTSQAPGTSQRAISIPSYDESCLDISLSPKGHDGIQVMEEKDLFPASFEECDTNLNGRHEADPMHVSQSNKQVGSVSMPIDIDLPINNTCNLPTTNVENGIGKNSAEVLYLENGSTMEVQTFGNTDRRGESLFTGLDGFPSNANMISDVHDGFGLMISELLGNQSPICSSVPTDFISLPNHMVLPNHEGILADDDFIFMSLGDIPISFLGSWEQPTQDYGKPF